MEYSHDIVAQSFVNSFIESRISEITSRKSCRNRCYTKAWAFSFSIDFELHDWESSFHRWPKAQSIHLLPNSEFQPNCWHPFSKLLLLGQIDGQLSYEFDMTRSLRRVRCLACCSPISLGTKPTTRKLFQSYSHCFGILLTTDGQDTSGDPVDSIEFALISRRKAGDSY